MAKTALRHQPYGRGKGFRFSLHLTRTGTMRTKQFEACVYTAGNFMGRSPMTCGWGRNPRAAVASALRKTAKVVGARVGAFARYR